MHNTAQPANPDLSPARPERGGAWTAGSAQMSVHLMIEEAGFRLEPASPFHALHVRLDHVGHVSINSAELADAFVLRPAASAFVPAQQPISWRISAGCKRLVLRISPAYLNELALAECCEITHPTAVREPAHDPVLEHYAGLLMHEAGRGEPLSAGFLSAFAQLAGSHVIRRYLKPAGSVSTASGLGSALRAKLDAFIQRTLPAPIVIEELALACGLSHYQLLRTIKRATQSTPQQYVLEARIELARKMLRESSVALTDIALALGFSSQSHFSNTFKAFTQCTPKSYRERTDPI